MPSNALAVFSARGCVVQLPSFQSRSLRTASISMRRIIQLRPDAQYCSVVPAMCQFTAAQERIMAETAMAD